MTSPHIDGERVEIEEWYRGGRVVRRFVNGIEVEPDTEPTAIQFCESVTTKTYMTPEEYKHRYSNSFNV